MTLFMGGSIGPGVSIMSQRSSYENKTSRFPGRAPGFETCPSLLRVPKSPPLKQCSQLCHSEVDGRTLHPPVFCSHVSLRTRPSCQGQSGTFPWEPAPGSPDLFRNARCQNKMRLGVSGLVRTVPPPPAGLSGLTTPAVCRVPCAGTADALVLSERSGWRHVWECSLLHLLDDAQCPTAPPAFPPRHYPRGQRLWTT